MKENVPRNEQKIYFFKYNSRTTSPNFIKFGLIHGNSILPHIYKNQDYWSNVGWMVVVRIFFTFIFSVNSNLMPSSIIFLSDVDNMCIKLI